MPHYAISASLLEVLRYGLLDFPVMSDDNSDSEPELLFPEEPDDFLPPPPPPTTTTYTLSTPPQETLTLRLVGHSPLWGHALWNAGKIASAYLETHASDLISGKTVLELGAGAGLPSLTCALRGASQVVVTDYPDAPLIENLKHNISAAAPFLPPPINIVAEGYLWGNSLDVISSHLPKEEKGFDLVILSDLLFNHSEHRKLLQTVLDTLKRTVGARAVVFFTPHTPWLYDKDMAFFKIAREAGLRVMKVLEEKLEAPMFEGDKGDRDLRRTVFGYEVRWKEFCLEDEPDEVEKA